MPEYPAEFLLAALVVTTLASGGLLGLWAATSRWHWFARTMVVLGLLMPLLWRPIFEPFVTLLAEVVTIVLGVMIYRRRWPRWRFSIADGLMGMGVVSVITAGMTRAPEMDFYLWRSTIGLGVVAGVCTLLAAWLVFSTNRRQLGMRTLAVSASLIALAYGWSLTEYTDLIFDVCERRCSYPYWNYYRFWEYSEKMLMEGLMAIITLVALLFLPLVLWRTGERLPAVFRGVVLGACLTLIATWPATVVWELSTPIPIPASTIEDNGYEGLVAIGNRLMMSNSPHAATQVKAIGDNDMNLVRRCLGKNIQVTSHYEREAWKIDNQNCEAMRALIDAIAKRGENARAGHDGDAAFAASRLLIDVADKLRGQGMGDDLEVWCRIEGQAALDAYKSLPMVSADQHQALRLRISEGASNHPSLASILHHQCCYEEHATGWGGHLGQFLTRLTENSHYVPGYRYGFAVRPQRNDSYLRYKMLSSLIATNLLLQEHHASHGEWPDGLDDLQSKTEACVWQDPFSPRGEALIYRREGEHYVLYSRWDDEQDDGGQLKKLVRNSPVGQIIQLDGDVSVENLMHATPAELERLAF